MKRSIKTLMLLTVVALLIVSIPIVAFAYDDDFTDDNVWRVGSLGTGVQIFGINNPTTNNSSSLTIGGTVKWKNREEKVIALAINSNTRWYNFSEMPNLKYVTVNSPVESICGSFRDCQKLISVHLADTIIYLYSDTFRNCPSLNNIDFSSKLEVIGQKCFQGDTNLAYVNLPSRVRTIGQYAFAYSGLTKIDIPSGVTKLNKATFANCTKLTTVTIPTSVTEISEDCFLNCPLKNVTYAGSSAQWANISISSGNSALTNVNFLVQTQPTPPPSTLPTFYTSYAGYYIVRGTSGGLAINAGPGTSYGQYSSIPEGTTVYISKATGYNGLNNSSGQWGYVTYGSISGYCAMNRLDYIGSTLDSSAPTIGEPIVSDLSYAGFTISVQVTDNMGVTRVRFPTWTPDTSVNGTNQDELVWYEGTKGSDGITWSCYVSTSDHKNETNCRYWTHIYAYDNAGNQAVYSTLEINVPANDTTAPTINQWDYFSVSSESFVVRAIYNDNIAPTSITFTISCGSIINTYNGNISPANTSGYYSDKRIYTSDFGNAVGTDYTCTVRVSDACGNAASRTLTVYIPVPDTEKPVISNVNITWYNVSGGILVPKDGKTYAGGMDTIEYSREYIPEVSFTVTDNVGLGNVYMPYWSAPNGQDDLTPNWASSGWVYVYHAYIPSSSGEIIKEKACHKYVFPQVHNNERDCEYIARIYAYDTSGNLSTLDVNLFMYDKPIEQNVITTIGGDGTDLHEVEFSWEPDDTANGYNLYISSEAGSNDIGCKQETWAYCADRDTVTAKLLLPAGTYTGRLDTRGYGGTLFDTTADITLTVPHGTAEDGQMAAMKEGDHKLYKAFASTTTWMGARDIAQKNPGHLASIENDMEQGFVSALAADAGFNAWIGAYFQTYDSLNQNRASFVWYNETNGIRMGFSTRVSYSNWDLGYPYDAENKMTCVQITPEGYWRAIGNDETDKNGGYIMEYDPIELTASLLTDTFVENSIPDRDDCEVIVIFEDGTSVVTEDFEMVLSGTSPGTQTLTLTYGGLSTTLDFSIVGTMDVPDFTLPKGIKRIENEAFEGGSMTVVKLPNGLESIGSLAFADCQSLREIYIPSSVYFIGNGVFQGCSSDLVIYGHLGSEAHRFAENMHHDFIPVLSASEE